MRTLYSKGVTILGLNQLIEAIAFGIPYSYFPRYAISLGSSIALIGLFTSSFMFMSAIFSPYLGAYSDRYGRKRLIIIGLIGDVILGALTGLAPSWEWLILIRALNGAATAAAVVPAEALLIDLAPTNKIGEATGFIMACATIGRNIGPLFGASIQWLSISSGFSELDSYRLPYFVDAGLACICVLLIALGIKERRINVKEKKESEKDKRFKIPKPFKLLLLVAFVTGIGEGFIRPIMALFFGDVFGAEPIEIGVLMSLSGFIALGASWLAGKGSDKFGRKIAIASGGIPARLLGTALALSPDLNTASIFYTVRGFMWRIYMVGLRSLRVDLAPLRLRGRLFGLYRTFFDIGDIIGPMLGTYLYDCYRFETFQFSNYTIPGYGVPFYFNTTIGLIVVMILLVYVKYEKPSTNTF